MAGSRVVAWLLIGLAAKGALGARKLRTAMASGQKSDHAGCLANLTFPGVTFSLSALTEGTKAWTDRNYVYTGVNSSGIPSGTPFWMGPHKSYGSGSFIFDAGGPGRLYFWSESTGALRNGGWASLYSQYKIGTLQWGSETEDVYAMDVDPGHILTFPVSTSEFVGGFAFGPVPANTTGCATTTTTTTTTVTTVTTTTTTTTTTTLPSVLTFPGVLFSLSTLTEGTKAWRDRNYVYTGVSSSGIPNGTSFWMGPHKSYGSGNFTFVAGGPGRFYFWSESTGALRDGGFALMYSRLGTYAMAGLGDRHFGLIGTLQWDLETEDVYAMNVTAGETVTLAKETSQFVGGFAFGPIPA